MNNFVKGFWLVLDDLSDIWRWAGMAFVSVVGGAVIGAVVSGLIAIFFAAVS